MPYPDYIIDARAPQADPSKNLTGPSNLADPSKNIGAIPAGGTPQAQWQNQFKPQDALSAALTPRGPLPSSPWAALQPGSVAAQVSPNAASPSLKELASGGLNHQQAWSAGQRVPTTNQAQFPTTPKIPDLLKRPERDNRLADMRKLYGWGSYAN